MFYISAPGNQPGALAPLKGDMMEIFTLDACVNCLMYAAGYSEHELGAPRPAAVAEGFDRISRDNSPELVIINPGGFEEDESESHFSWSPCDICLSSLGGDRHPVTVIVGA